MKEERKPYVSVQSSVIDMVGHYRKPDVLFVKFKNGRTYQYKGVSVQRYGAFMRHGNEGKSMGEYFNTKIKPNYKCKEIK